MSTHTTQQPFVFVVRRSPLSAYAAGLVLGALLASPVGCGGDVPIGRSQMGLKEGDSCPMEKCANESTVCGSTSGSVPLVFKPMGCKAGPQEGSGIGICRLVGQCVQQLKEGENCPMEMCGGQEGNCTLGAKIPLAFKATGCVANPQEGSGLGTCHVVGECVDLHEGDSCPMSMCANQTGSCVQQPDGGKSIFKATGCVANPQEGSGVGTCSVVGECVPELKAGDTCPTSMCANQTGVCAQDEGRAVYMASGCVANPQEGSGVGTCRLTGQCVAELKEGDDCPMQMCAGQQGTCVRSADGGESEFKVTGCVANPQTGSSVGTCVLTGECVPK